MKRRSLTAIKVSLAIAITAIGYVYVSSPGKVVVNESGAVIGLVNEARSVLQGNRFWTNQLSEVKSEIERNISEPRRWVKMNQELEKSLQQANQFMEETYKKHPTMRPTLAAQQAQALRNRANQIEQDEVHALIEEARMNRLEQLRKILPIVQSRIS